MVSIPLEYKQVSTDVVARATDPDSCPGYQASNIVTTDSSLTADLTLAGTACNVYSDDIQDLKLLVEYQTSKYAPLLKKEGLLLDDLLYST